METATTLALAKKALLKELLQLIAEPVKQGCNHALQWAGRRWSSGEAVTLLLAETDEIKGVLARLQHQDLNSGLSAAYEGLANYFQTPSNLSRAEELFKTAMDELRRAISMVPSPTDIVHVTKLRIAAHAARSQVCAGLGRDARMEAESARSGMKEAWRGMMLQPAFASLLTMEFGDAPLSRFLESANLFGRWQQRKDRYEVLLESRALAVWVDSWLERQDVQPLRLKAEAGGVTVSVHQFLALECNPEPLTRHKGLLSLAVSGNTLFSGSLDHTIRVWDVATREHVATLNGHTSYVEALVVSNDLLFSGSWDCTIRIWSVSTREHVATLAGHTNWVSALAVSGELLCSGSDEGDVRIWSVAARECVARLDGHTDGVSALVVSGDLLFSGSSDKTVRIWSVANRRDIATLTGHTRTIKALAVSGDFLFSGSADASIRVWGIAAREHITTLTGHADRISALALSGDLLFSGSSDNTVRIWSVPARGHVWTFNGQSRVCALAVSGGLVISGWGNGTIRIWGRSQLPPETFALMEEPAAA